MYIKNINEGVSVWEQIVTIPTYDLAEPDKNPMFFEKRVYNGSAGKIYPYSVIDDISSEKKDKEYKAVFLENKYIHVMILPELGGKIQRAYDKIRKCDFIYYNDTIKPTLAGFGGPFLAGGISFNWPNRYRIGQFPNMRYISDHNPDGSCSVILSSTEKMSGIKGNIEITLYPDRSYIEVNSTANNLTGLTQPFSWWTEIFVPMTDYTQTIFPPDVNRVISYEKNETSKFPVATDVFAGNDFSSGVDISMNKNISQPLSFMTCTSKFDFSGIYDYANRNGLLYISDHHVSPNKGFSTYGAGNYGQTRYSSQNDDGMSFTKLINGSYTDNIHDFSYLPPFGEKCVKHFFLPFHEVGAVKNATVDAALNITVSGDLVSIVVYATSTFNKAKITVYAGDEICFQNSADLSPENIYSSKYVVDTGLTGLDLKVDVTDNQGRSLVSYMSSAAKNFDSRFPETDRNLPSPESVNTVEELYLHGKHLEQVPHPLYTPDDYYLEGLSIDPTDTGINNAYGALLLKRGDFAGASEYFKKAIKKLAKANLNLQYGEVFYNLGLAQKFINNNDLAYDSFYKATWSDSRQSASFYQLACILTGDGDYHQALNFLDNALIKNSHNVKARTLKSAILRILGIKEKAKDFAAQTLSIDPLNFAAIYETRGIQNLLEIMGNEANDILELAIEYANASLFDDAKLILNSFRQKYFSNEDTPPLVLYYLALYYRITGDEENANKMLILAHKSDFTYCFPHRLEDLAALNNAVVHNPKDSMAYYYLGCFWYDKKQYEKAISCWETSKNLNASFPTVHRNLAIGYFNKINKPVLASQELRKAFELNPNDSRLFTELDQLNRKLGLSPSERLIFFEDNMEIVHKRDDLYIEYVKLRNFSKDYEGALKLIEARKFNPKEGSEGKISAQYVFSIVEMARQSIVLREFENAISLLNRALAYPANIGEGKLPGVQENQVLYYLGVAHAGLKNISQAESYFTAASEGINNPDDMLFRYNQPLEGIYYQGLSLLKLGYEAKARSKFNNLINYGEKHMDDAPGDDYFQVPLSERHIFEDDPARRNKTHCLYMMGLGYLGLGVKTKAKDLLTQAFDLDVNHLGVRNHLEQCFD